MISQQLYASFPWYDLLEMRAATDAWWAALRSELAADGWPFPASLDRERPHGTDFDGECGFTQTCGYPLVTTARGHFTVLGAPRYRVPGCIGSWHRSYIVVRDAAPVCELEALRGLRFAINERDSNSGMNLPRRLFAPFARGGRFFGGTVVTGSHAASAALVGAGGADAAAIDCVTFAYLRAYRPSAITGLRVIAETAATPTPPLVTSCFSGGALVAALRCALTELGTSEKYAAVRSPLFLDGVDLCGEDAYEVVMRYERESMQLGYPQLV